MLLTIGSATIINTVYDLQNGKPAPVTVLAGGATAAILIIAGSATGSWELVEAIGVAVLITSLFLHGAKIAGISTALNSTKTKTSATPGAYIGTAGPTTQNA